MKILNLDKLEGEDKKIVLNGKEYIIPGKLSVRIMFKLLNNSQKLGEDPNNYDLNMESFELLAEIFRIKNPDVTVDHLLDTVTMDQYTELVTFIFLGGEADDPSGKKPDSTETSE